MGELLLYEGKQLIVLILNFGNGGIIRSRGSDSEGLSRGVINRQIFWAMLKTG